MAFNPPTNGTSTDDQLIHASVATTTIAVNSRLESLLAVVDSPSTGNAGIDRTLEGIRDNLESLISTQSTEQEEIKKLLREALDKEVLEHLTREIEAKIDKCIDETVAGLVERELETFISKELRERVDKQRTDMQRLQVAIHNSEAKRSNSFIKTQKQFGESLHHLINEKGNKSEMFPKTIKELLSLEDAKVIELVKFYGNKSPDRNSRVPNLNWFLKEIGVTYQSDFLG